MLKKIILHFSDIIKNPYLCFFLLYKYIFFVIFRFKTKPILNLNITKPSLNKSFIRWWDWETNSVLWISFSFEKSSKKLKMYLKNIINYNWDKILLWLPIKFIVNEEKNTNFIKIWKTTRLYLNKNIVSNKLYWDAFFFRDIWNFDNFTKFYDGTNLFLVWNEDTIKKVLDKNIKLIWTYSIPYKNSFNNYFVIKNNIVDKIKNLENSSNFIVLVSWWPFAKALCFDLTMENNYICHDVWAIFDIYL